MKPLFICTDLDRTLLPNGEHPESPQARPMFTRFVDHPDVSLAYVSGRHLALVEHSMREYSLPIPNWIVADVGSSIYHTVGNRWELMDSWSQWIARDWQGLSASELEPLFSDLSDLIRQPADRQNHHKLSFFVPLNADIVSLTQRMKDLLDQCNIHVSFTYSMDEVASVGLLDLLPLRATKLHAVEYLMQDAGFAPTQTLFAGDSGNDLSVLVSPLPAVLVANAHRSVVERARTEASLYGTSDRLYVARGDFLGMNGNYSAGILEGIAHFHADSMSRMV
jgi:HAD superfamily hydrolase (TIGR01484 family)